MFFLTYKKNIEASSAKSVPIAVPIAVHTVYFCVQLIYIHQQQEVFLKSLQIQAILFWIFYVFLTSTTCESDLSSFISFENESYINFIPAVLE